MEINQNSYSKDLPQINPNRSLFIASSSTPFLSFSSAAGDPLASEEVIDEQPSARKVKLLCSFGGKILPRPSDGVLRYAGGHTRIIAVRRDISLLELYRKMTDAYGGPVAIRYQLPDEDLDALVSVSSTEDLDNMMDEYDKLAEGSADGSAKLRVFLFSQAEIPSALAENFLTGPALINPYDSGKIYIEAVNGGVISEAITNGEIRLKGSTASATSTQNSDMGLDIYNNQGTSSPVLSPAAEVSAFNDPSKLAFVGIATSVPLQEARSFPANSSFLGQTLAATRPLNPPQMAPFPSQAFVEPHHVHCDPHSQNTSLLGNVASAPQRAYLPPMTMSPTSILTQVGSMNPVQVKVDAFSDEDQFGKTIVPPVSDPNYKVFSQPLCQIPPLHSSHLHPPIVEWHELHLVPPLSKVPQLRFENCQMCQKALPHVHSDILINELGNASGNSMPNAHPMLHSHHSDDITVLHGQHRAVSVAMMESLEESKVEHAGNPNQNGTCGMNKVPVSVLNKEFFMPTTEKVDHSKLMGAVGLSGDTQASYEVTVSPLQSHLDGSFHQMQNQVLHNETFQPVKFLHPTDSFGVSSNGQSNGIHPSSQNHSEDCLLKLNVQSDLNANGIQVLHPSGTMLSSSGETSYGAPLRPPQPHHEESFMQQQFFAAKAPLLPLKQIVSDKQLNRDSIMANLSYDALELLNQSQDYVKQVDDITQALNVNTFDTLRSKGQLKPSVVPITDVSKDMKPESLFVIGDNHTLRAQNGCNFNAFISNKVGPEEISDKLVNPLISRSAISGEIKYESSSVHGEDNNTVKSNCVGSRLPFSDALVSPGFLPKDYPINPLLSTTMDLHLFELANTSQVSTMAGSGVLTQNMGRNAKPIFSNQHVPVMSSYFVDTSYINTCIGGASGAWTDEVSQPQHLINDLSAPQRGNAPFQLPSSTVLGYNGQFQEFVSSSQPGNENCQEILESLNTYHSRAAVVTSREPTVSVNTSNGNHFSKVDVPDIAMLLEEGALQPPIDWLIKNSHPGNILATKDSGADFINQDTLSLVNQDKESMLPSSIPPVSVVSNNGPNEMNPPFLKETGLSEENSSSQSPVVLGDQKIEDIKVKHSNKLHMGLPNAKDIGRLQIIKNCDLEELRELGSGTFGTVYHGKWRGSDVAIKRINDRCFAGKPSEQEKMRSDFWNEASKLADLHHPNVVAFYGVVLDGPGGSFSTVTEYMVNGSLRNALQRNDKTIDRRKQLIIAMDVAFGMEYLHGKNIVHFDLKSDNLLVNLRDPQRPICKVGDLGLSKVKCQTLISGGVRGTLPWMAPELLNGSSNLVSDKVDVFSFGIVMWELLTGEEPYSDLHYGTIIGGIVSNTLRPPVPENCDPEWRALMEQCWSAEPSERPSFSEIANRLRAMAPLPQKGKSQK